MKVSLNIKSRLTLWYLLIAAALIVFFSTTAYFLLSNGLRGKTIHPWDMRYAQIQETAEGQNIITGFSELGRQDWGGSGQATVMRCYSRNELFELSSPEGIISIDDILLEEAALDDLNMSEDYSIWFYTDVFGNTTGVVAVTRSANDVEAILGTFSRVLLVIGPVALVLASLLGYFLIKRSLHPVQVMASTARKIEERNLDKRLDVHGDDELGQLAATLNHMLTRLEGAFNRERQFIADASHELRTPLAVVQGEATLALKKERNIEEYQKSLETISQETERLSSTLKRLLFLARDESIKQLEFEEVNLKGLLAEVASDIEMLCEEKTLHFQLHVQDNLIIKGDEVSLRELFLNLLDNAIRYTPQGGDVSLTLGRKGNNAYVAVKDTGAGIPEEHLKHIFKRFYRVDKSRSRSEGGAGLGLSICQRIVEFHYGTIEVESKVGEGSTFSVLLPLIGSSS